MIQVVQRALDILECVAQDPETPKGLGEIAERVELNAATCARILQTLVAAGYVEQMGPRKGYRLGPMAYALAAQGPYRKDLVHVAQPVLERLAGETQETVLLAVLHQGRRVTLCEVEGTQIVQVRSDRLQLYDPLRTATGRLLLAYLDDTRRKSCLETSETYATAPVSTREQMEAELVQARRDGRVIRTSEGHVVGIAYPVWEGETVAAALGLHLPEHRFTGEHRDRVLEAMERAAREMSERVRARRPA
jgi:IclR family KDG regulon transcriptional repressor